MLLLGKCINKNICTSMRWL